MYWTLVKFLNVHKISDKTLERRLLTLEQAVSDLQQKINNQPTSENWLQKLIGSISDEAAFMEALEYGRTSRQTDKSTEEVKKLTSKGEIPA